MGNSIYVTTKYALARWARRVSASWAANGVRINTVAPGNVSTPMTATMSENAKAALAALPIPINYGTDELMHPEDIANVIVFLVSPLAHGINGNVMFVPSCRDNEILGYYWTTDECDMEDKELSVELMYTTGYGGVKLDSDYRNCQHAIRPVLEQ